ncbi:MAG: 16S rRNA (guanine(966)-N(2))-methyltransferase RsmD [Bacteroidales bacterium]|nr:16S rRNA (guanine(966)-N(2))-methyltransferase RsmD [Bacteroidales bacterium]MEE0948052.1 16S rRNA (guanine(966)-N(2))-methyltransferase RsmD [Bacteroidales bacterium]
MRIISGEFKGRKLRPPVGLPVRPTTDMAREALFNILRNKIEFEQVSVLDLFSGTGAIGFEFISRGVQSVTSIEQNPKCIDFQKRTAEDLGIKNHFPLRMDVFNFLGRSKQKFDLVFADPPYDLKQFDMVPELVIKSFLKPEGIFVLEHSKEHNYESYDWFVEQRHYGKVNFSFFQNPEEQE